MEILLIFRYNDTVGVMNPILHGKRRSLCRRFCAHVSKIRFPKGGNIMKKRFTALLLSLCLLLTLTPVSAFAADGDAIYVGGVELTGSASAPAYALTEDGAVTTAGADESSYNIKWDGSTLTLDDATVTQGAYALYGDDSGGAAIFCETDFEIEPVGSNTVFGPDVTGSNVFCESYGIFAESDLVIAGSGTLNVTGGRVSGASFYQQSSGINALTVIMNSGTVTAAGGEAVCDAGSTAESNSCGIDSDLTVSGGMLIATGGTATGRTAISVGISNYGDVDILGGTVTATGTAAAATGESDYAYSYGIDAGSITVSGGTMEAAGGTATAPSENVHSYGAAIFGSFQISGGVVTVTGNDSAVDPDGGVVLITPQTGEAIVVQAGENAQNAAQISGSPFTELTFITDLIPGEKYLYSETAEASTPSPDPPVNEADVYVGGVEFTGSASAPVYAVTENGAVTTAGADESNYNIKWDGSTLTFNNAEITCGTYTDYGEEYAVYCETDFEIELVGSNTVSGPDIAGADTDGESYGIYGEEALVISGSGSLNVTGGRIEVGDEYYAYSSGINAYSVTIESGEVSASGGSVIGGDAESYGISAAEVAIEGGELTAAGGTATCTGEYAYAYSSGIYSDGITITGGTLNARGGVASDTGGDASTYSFGLEIYGDVLVNSANVYAEGSQANVTTGIYAENDFRIESGSILAFGGRAVNQADPDWVASAGVVAYNAILSGGTLAAAGSTGSIYYETELIIRPENEAITVRVLDHWIAEENAQAPDWNSTNAAASELNGSPFTAETVLPGTATAGMLYFSATDDPSAPIVPADPSEPTDPTDPTAPTDPTDPTDPTNPSDSAAPTGSAGQNANTAKGGQSPKTGESGNTALWFLLLAASGLSVAGILVSGRRKRES